jgi:deoxyribose-phosphate aldolase
MVLNIGQLRGGENDGVLRDMEAVVRVAHAGGALVKVILETALLSEDQKVAACILAQRAGADFVKTSTGFGPGGATVEDVALLRRTAGPAMGVKASGGIRTLEDLKKMVAAGASRIGTSSGVRIMEEAAR